MLGILRAALCYVITVHADNAETCKGYHFWAALLPCHFESLFMCLAIGSKIRTHSRSESHLRFQKLVNTAWTSSSVNKDLVPTVSDARWKIQIQRLRTRLSATDRAAGVAKHRVDAAISNPCRIRYSFADMITTSSKTSQGFVGQVSYEQSFLRSSVMFKALFHLLFRFPEISPIH